MSFKNFKGMSRQFGIDGKNGVNILVKYKSIYRKGYYIVRFRTKCVWEGRFISSQKEIRIDENDEFYWNIQKNAIKTLAKENFNGEEVKTFMKNYMALEYVK